MEQEGGLLRMRRASALRRNASPSGVSEWGAGPFSLCPISRQDQAIIAPILCSNKYLSRRGGRLGRAVFLKRTCASSRIHSATVYSSLLRVGRRLAEVADSALALGVVISVTLSEFLLGQWAQVLRSKIGPSLLIAALFRRTRRDGLENVRTLRAQTRFRVLVSNGCKETKGRFPFVCLPIFIERIARSYASFG